jgi:hypothetical protein
VRGDGDYQYITNFNNTLNLNLDYYEKAYLDNGRNDFYGLPVWWRFRRGKWQDSI